MNRKWIILKMRARNRKTWIVPFAFFVAACTVKREEPAVPEILVDGYPRSFIFWTNAREISLEESEPEPLFRLLDGVASPSDQWETFLEFKRRNPEKLTYLFTQGHVFSQKPTKYDPIDRTEFFAGHWVYFEGCRITNEVRADTLQTQIHVEDPTLFRRIEGSGGNRFEDMVLCKLRMDGTLDYSVAEQLKILGIDTVNGILHVRRGCYGTEPVSLKAGAGWAASHAYHRWGGISWCLNYSTECPLDSAGRSASDILLDEYVSLFGPGGQLEIFDGLEYDAFHAHPGSTGPAGRSFDTDGDGIGDNAIADGINLYGIGMYRYIARLREELGAGVLIMGDGSAGRKHQRCVGNLNGIESEWWPKWGDMDCTMWSEGINAHRFWKANSAKPYFSYIVHKVGGHNEDDWLATPYSTHRLVMAGAQFIDAAITTFFPVPPAPGEEIGIFDELIKGREKVPNWLGRPLGPPVRLALESDDILKLSGLKGRGVSPGSVGSPGSDGSLGSEGYLGVSGAPGSVGSLGSVGSSELKGSSGTGDSTGASGSSGSDGSLGVSGAPGSDVAPGVSGAPGRKMSCDLRIHTALQMDTGEGSIVLTSPASDSGHMRFSIRNIACKGPDLFVSVKMKASPIKGYPVDYPRRVVVHTDPSGSPAEQAFLLNEKWFRAEFYFREMDAPSAELHFEVEGAGSVRISEFSAHMHPDAIYRVFENGLVLANPSDEEFTFDLDDCDPGHRWRRLRGTENQDPETNDGSEVAGNLVLGPRDALFLVRME